jgi:hypothetical protein
LLSVRGEQQTIGIDATIAAAWEAANHSYAEALQQRTGRFKATGRIMVAADKHHVKRGHPAGRARHEIIELALRRDRRILAVKNVPGDQQGINGMLLQSILKPGKERRMLVIAGEVMEFLAKMPVRRMEDFHLWTIPSTP